MQTALCGDESELANQSRAIGWPICASSVTTDLHIAVAYSVVACHESTMARPNYSGEKRRKELEKQKKKEEKKQRKLNNASAAATDDEATPADAGEQPPVPSPS